jgi:3-hydroxyisobutyrate dehydrogenase-like beta-hydroxyacid dehydrogenase
VQGYARRIASESLDAGAGFTVDLALKDVRYMRQLAEASRCPLRVAGERHGWQPLLLPSWQLVLSV